MFSIVQIELRDPKKDKVMDYGVPSCFSIIGQVRGFRFLHSLSQILEWVTKMNKVAKLNHRPGKINQNHVSKHKSNIQPIVISQI